MGILLFKTLTGRNTFAKKDQCGNHPTIDFLVILPGGVDYLYNAYSLLRKELFMKIFKALTPIVIITIFLTSPSFAQWSFDTSITTGVNSSGIAITSDGSKLVVTNNTNPGSVKIISTSNYSVSNIDISSIENYPNAVTIAPNDSTALVNTLHKTIFIDLFNHSIKGVFTAPCAGTTLYGIAVTPNGQNAVYPDLSSGCTQQGVRLIDATGKSSVTSFIPVNTSGELEGIAITPDGGSAIVTTFSSDSPKKVNLLTSEIQNIAGISSGSYGVAILHNGNEALIFDGDSLDRVSLISNSVTNKISYLSYNTGFQNIAITSDDKYAFVAGSFEKLIISLADNSVIQTFTAGGTSIATSPDGSIFYVTDSYNGTVRVYKRQIPSEVKNEHNPIPLAFLLQQNYPNPFNPNTIINYAIPKKSIVVIKVYDVLGNEVATLLNEEKNAGNYRVEFNGNNLASGIYFYRITTGDFVSVKKMLLLK